jgi:spore coat polysaccharide biosynthesis predicted glycosyltransferase SpsG
MRRIEVWFDGGGGYGLGNIRRSGELAACLRHRGHEVGYVPLSNRAALLSSMECGTRMKASMILLDVPYAGDVWVRTAHESGARVLALDYDGEEAPEYVISLQNVRRVPTRSRAFFGVKYAIIRQEIRQLGTHHHASDEILVILGGGDKDGLVEEVMERLPGRPLCVVQGPLGRILQIERERTRVLANPQNLPEIMSGCAWAVTTGGTTLLEMLCLGKAVHVVPRTPAEEAFAAYFHKRGAVLGCGVESIREPPAADLLRCMRAGPSLIDGSGSQRIVCAVEALLNHDEKFHKAWDLGGGS